MLGWNNRSGEYGYFASGTWWGRLKDWAGRWWPQFWRSLMPFIALLALVHVVLALVFPGGYNALTGARPAELAYLTHFRSVDAFGFWANPYHDPVVSFKIYTQEGQNADGSFPMGSTNPAVRYERWVHAAAFLVSQGEGQGLPFGEYLAHQAASTPFKLDLRLGQRRWTVGAVDMPPVYAWSREEEVISFVGSRNGLTREWAVKTGENRGIRQWK